MYNNDNDYGDDYGDYGNEYGDEYYEEDANDKEAKTTSTAKGTGKAEEEKKAILKTDGGSGKKDGAKKAEDEAKGW